jgi:hypothetical protein
MLIGIIAVLVGFGAFKLYWEVKHRRLEKRMKKAKR